MIDQSFFKNLKKFELITRKLVSQQLAGQYHAVFKGRGMDFDELKPYIIGDDPRYIDWNASAKYQQLHVKHFIEERMLSVYFILDSSPSMHFASISQSKILTATEAFAIIALSALLNNDTIGLLAFSNDQLTFIPQKKGKNHLLTCLDQISKLKPTSQTNNLTTAIIKMAKIAKKKSLICIISDFLDPNFEKPLQVLAHKHDVIPIKISDPLEFALPDLASIYLADAENNTHITLETSSKKNRQLLEDYARKQHEKILQSFTASKLQALELSTNTQVLPIILKFFQKRFLHA